ncbi:MAG: YifB family Mg chelatase-like AAA ATPase [Acidobacteria bacterium]|nr:YifB family Mg chelatase-like AAA ATPase [Acidobacteriota bacterium]
MLARVRSATLLGVEAIPLIVECDISRGLPGIHTVGLPDAAVRESADRVRAAIRNAGFEIPPRRITISLAPADLRKQGAALDLPIALGILVANGDVPSGRLANLLVIGELALDGVVRNVPGCLPAALLARESGIEEIVVPRSNREEALAVPGPGVHGVERLLDAVAVLWGAKKPERATAATFQAAPAGGGLDLADVKGQAHARRALEVAAAGGHHLLMVGPPGCGKTMLARRLPAILPPLALDESVEVTCVYSAAGLLRQPGLLRHRPFRAPHHTISGVGLVGGGRGPRPGEVTLAHHGVLFLDEMAEFGRGTLDVLRQPLEDGLVVITRAGQATRMPCRFVLVGAMNPCVCGNLGRSDRPCACTPSQVAQYRSRVSGPLLDRFEIQVEVPPVPVADLVKVSPGEPSAVVAARIFAARRRRNENEEVEPAPSVAAQTILHRAIRGLGLSARAHDGVLRVARTIAHLEGSPSIEPQHVAEAIQYRCLDRSPVRSER